MTKKIATAPVGTDDDSAERLRLDADFDARWAAWQTRGRSRDRAVRRTLVIAGPSGGHCRSDRSSPPDQVIP